VRLSRSIEIRAPLEEVWDYLADPDKYCDFVAGLIRWDVISDQPNGLGARYKMLIRVGAANAGGIIEIVEWRPPTDMALHSVTGADQRFRWRLRPGSGGRTKAELRWAYGVAGSGLGGLIAERVAARQLRRDLKTSMVTLKREIETGR
jgi:carbon monoxide dehydrogenase subunit G